MNIPSLLIISTSFDVMILVAHPVACADDEFLSDDAWSVDDDVVGVRERGKEARQFFS